MLCRPQAALERCIRIHKSLLRFRCKCGIEHSCEVILRRLLPDVHESLDSKMIVRCCQLGPDLLFFSKCRLVIVPRKSIQHAIARLHKAAPECFGQRTDQDPDLSSLCVKFRRRNIFRQLARALLEFVDRGHAIMTRIRVRLYRTHSGQRTVDQSTKSRGHIHSQSSSPRLRWDNDSRTS